MTGPIHISGAKRGDAIEVEIVDIAPDEYGYTVVTGWLLEGCFHRAIYSQLEIN